MAKTKGIVDGLKTVGKSTPALGVIIPIATALIPIVVDKIEDLKEEQKDLIEIPSLCLKDFPMELEQASNVLKEHGLKVQALVVREAHIRYKDCIDFQVVGTKPKSNQKVKPSSLVFLKYVTPDVIEKSRALFEESEKRKAEVKLEKENKKIEQREKTKKILNDTIANIQQSVVGVATNTKNQIQKITTRHDKVEEVEEQPDA